MTFLFNPVENKEYTRNRIFLLGMISFLICYEIFFLYQLNCYHKSLSVSNILSSFLVFKRLLVEFLGVIVLGLILLNLNKYFRIIYYFILFVFVAIYMVQLYAFYLGGEFISQVSLENIDHIYLFYNYKNILLVSGGILAFLVFSFLIEFKFQNRSSWKAIAKSIALLACLVLFAFPVVNWMPKSIIQKSNDCLHAHSLSHIGPVSTLYESFFVRGAIFGEDYKYPRLRKDDLKEINKFGFHYKPNKEFPFIKGRIYATKAPFSIKSNQEPAANIIIFFTEGFSARAIEVYDSKYDDLTPHINDFAKSSMVVKNYYNHTAATYRGLHGQLCSLYPEFGGGTWMISYDYMSQKNYLCLNNVLENDGYDTIFLDSHHKDHISRVDEMMVNLGFETVLTGDVLAQRYLENARPEIKNAYSDKQYMHSTISFLKDRLTAENKDKPFIMSLYNFGTHAMLPMASDGREYRDGSNQSLNTIHTFDDAFGMFWEYYRASPYAKDTIIIFTSDHAHYPEKPFVEAFQEAGYQEYFVDEIPLIIHDPLRKLPDGYDANFSTSIDFTPSLIHYLGLENRSNPFLGMSLFERQEKEYSSLGVTYFGPKDLYVIDQEKIHRLHFSEKHKERLKSLQKFTFSMKFIEIKNKLWNKERDNHNK